MVVTLINPDARRASRSAQGRDAAGNLVIPKHQRVKSARAGKGASRLAAAMSLKGTQVWAGDAKPLACLDLAQGEPSGSPPTRKERVCARSRRQRRHVSGTADADGGRELGYFQAGATFERRSCATCRAVQVPHQHVCVRASVCVVLSRGCSCSDVRLFFVRGCAESQSEARSRIETGTCRPNKLCPSFSSGTQIPSYCSVGCV